MRRVAVLLLSAFAWSRVSAACTCVTVPVDPGPPEIDTVGHDPEFVVFLGTVDGIRSLAPPDSDRPYFFGAVATFRVERYWGGAVVPSTFQVATGNVGGACGVPWKQGDCYLVSAWLQDGSWKTDTCSITTRIADKPEILKRLQITDGPGLKPAEPRAGT